MKRENAGVANNILCREITVGAVDEEFVEEGNPNDDNGSEGEGVPVAEVIREEVSVDASVAGNLKVSEHNNEMSEMSTWEVSLQNLPIDFVFNVDFLWKLGLRVSVPIAWCKNTKDISHNESFVPAYITRISKHQYEVTDEDDVEMFALEWDGDEGVRNFVECTYIQFPAKKPCTGIGNLRVWVPTYIFVSADPMERFKVCRSFSVVCRPSSVVWSSWFLDDP